MLERFRVVAGVAGVLGSGTMAFTLMACYGGACVDDNDCSSRGYGNDASATDATRDARRGDVRVSDPSVEDASIVDASDAGGDPNDGGGGDGGDGG